jgi:hypothetical protein
LKNIFLIIAITILVNSILSQDSLHLVATITGEQIGDQFGDVAGLGDVNGDGFDDFIVGAPAGEYVKIYFGGATFDTIADLRFNGNDTLVMTSKVAGAGDVNNDGYDDVLLGGFYNNGGFPKSIVFLYYGGANMDTIPDFQFIPPYGIQNILGQISGAGDVNNDGYDDFIIGVPYNWYDGIGRAYLFLGGDTLASQPFLTFASDSLEDFFGKAVTGIGDMNGDNFYDIAISAPEELGIEDSGRVFIYYGGMNIDNLFDKMIIGPDIYFGTGLGNSGDINGDFSAEFLISSYSQVFIYSYEDTLIKLNPTNWGMGGLFGIGECGDINNDNYNDIVMGNTGQKDSSGIYVGGIRGYFGGIEIDTTFDIYVIGKSHYSQFGKSISVNNDINNDNFDDIIVGAPGNTGEPGKVYVFSYRSMNTIEDENDLFQDNLSCFDLYKSYPNPFNSTTTISYKLFYTSEIKIEIYNCSGQRIKVIKKGLQKPGFYSHEWKGTSDANMQVSSGVYFIRLSVKTHSLPDQKSAVQKLVLIK